MKSPKQKMIDDLKEAFSGQILAPNGLPYLMNQIIAHNNENRRRLQSHLGRWQELFEVNEMLIVNGVQFRVADMHPGDLLILGNPHCEKEDGWVYQFREGMRIAIKGLEFEVAKNGVYCNTLLLVCKGSA